VVVPGSTPITGVNLGNLGFMTELSVDEAETKLAAIIGGEGWIDQRSLLEARLSPPPGNGRQPREFFALNDVVLARGEVARVIYVEATVDGSPLTAYKADGVIVATATGSTGYSLSAGGPVLYPQSGDMLLLPIVPHLSPVYPLVLPPATMIKLRLRSTYPATLSVDGHINLPLSSGAEITITHSRHTVRFLRVHPAASFFRSLERKLKG
jgi:NAD+ kinase